LAEANFFRVDTCNGDFLSPDWATFLDLLSQLLFADAERRFDPTSWNYGAEWRVFLGENEIPAVDEHMTRIRVKFLPCCFEPDVFEPLSCSLVNGDQKTVIQAQNYGQQTHDKADDEKRDPEQVVESCDPCVVGFKIVSYDQGSDQGSKYAGCEHTAA
jgi:hypothetical protein